MDSISSSVGSAVAASVQSSCRDAYSKLLLPGLNALTQQIFAQVNDNFSRGTRECELSVLVVGPGRLYILPHLKYFPYILFPELRHYFTPTKMEYYLPWYLLFERVSLKVKKFDQMKKK